MNSRELNNFVGEYPNVLARAAKEGWLRPLVASHLTACTRETASGLLRELADLPAYVAGSVNWRSRPTRGRARWNRLRKRYGLTLPTEPGSRGKRLRIGLVLHEAAHVYDHLGTKKFSHGPTFCKELRDLLAQHWTGSWRERCTITMTVHNYHEIYGRHRGPFWILLTRQIEKKGGKVEQQTDKVDGPLSAEEAHEEARTLVNAKNDNVVDAHVFSISEGQFIGAFYARGNEYASWSQMRSKALETIEEEEPDGRVELPDQRDAPALLQGGTEPVRSVDDPEQPGLPGTAVPARRPVRDVPAKVAAGPRAQRARAALELDPGNAERWPKSEGATIVRSALEAGGPATASDLAQRVAADCAKVGVAFPASLISRLKQGGFLREVAA